MEEMRRSAYETVLRACGFASLAIFCVMIGLSFLPRSAFQAGGFLSMTMALVLVFKAREARTKDHRRTEMWLYLPKDRRPPEAHGRSRCSSPPSNFSPAPRVRRGVRALRYLRRARRQQVSYDLRLGERRQVLPRAPKNCAIENRQSPVELVQAESTIGTFQSNM
jgi:hypothetical protein